MYLSTRVKNFLKTGKINYYEQLKNLLLEQTGEEVALMLSSLQREEKEQLLNECWPKLTDERKRLIASSLYQDKLDSLFLDYDELSELEQIKRLDILGYISCPEVVTFLLKQMKSKREGIRLSACGALKNQDPQLVLEPVLQALVQPDQWLPSRVFEVLQSLGPGLDRQLLNVLEDVDEKVQEVIVQILGEIGGKSCVPVMEKILPGAGDSLRLRIAEALEKLKCKDSWPLLVKLLEDDRWQTRMLAAKALGQLGQEQVIPLLEARKNIEKDTLVSECILDALAALEEGTVEIVSNWVRER